MAWRRLLLWSVVTSLALQLCAGVRLTGGVCALSCCSGQPSCAEAQHVTCDCPQLDTITLGRGDIPSSLLSFRIQRVGLVVLQDGAFSGLSLLTRFNISNVRNVTVEQGGITLETNFFVNMESIGSVQIKSLGVSGLWDTLKFAAIDSLHIEKDALHNTSGSLGHNLTLQDIGKLSMDSDAIQTSVSLMVLKNAVIKVCHPHSFGKRIRTTIIDNVTITEAKRGCITGYDKQTTLSVQSSIIGDMYPLAISGKLRKLIIDNTVFLKVHERALDLQLVDMKVSGLTVQQFSADGMTVRADDSILLEKIFVNSLQRRALAGLQTGPTLTGFSPPLVIKGMTVLEAEPGSLAFSKCADLQVSGLRVLRSSSSSLCPTEKLTRELTDAAERGPLSPAQCAIYWQLRQNARCEQDDHLPSPVVDQEHHCEVSSQTLSPGGVTPVYRSSSAPTEESTSPATGDDRRQPEAHAAPGPAVVSLAEHHRGLVLYLTLGVVLTTAVLATVLVVKLRRRRRDRRSSGPEMPSVAAPPSVAEAPSGVETLLMVMANRLLHQENERGGGAGRPGAPPAAGSSSVESHDYEAIRPELLQPPPRDEPLIRFEDNSGDNLLRRENESGGGRPSAAPSAGRSSVDNHDYLAIRPEMLQPPHYETLNRLENNADDNLLRQEKETGGGGGRPAAPTTAGRSSVDSHVYEDIQPADQLQPLIRFDQDNSVDNQPTTDDSPQYNNMMGR